MAQAEEMGLTEFEIVNLPKLQPEDYNINNALARQVAEKMRDLRLHALQVAPEAFGSSYETEVARGLDQTIERLKTPHAHHFFGIDRTIAAWTKNNDAPFFETLLAARWVCMLVLIGPLTDSESLAISSKRDPLQVPDRSVADAESSLEISSESLHFHLSGVFVAQDCRHAGLGKRMIHAALNKATAEATRRGQKVHCTVLVDSDNTAASRLYEKMGFRATGRESYVQQPRLQMGELQVQERLAVKMELFQMPQEG